MTFLRKVLALSAVLAVAVALFGSVATTASAGDIPFTAYGTGSNSGDVIIILSNSTSPASVCETVTADSEGNWGPVSLAVTDGDCSFPAGTTISFCLNGTVADQTEIWSAGGAPSNVATGTVLTVAAAAAAAAAATNSESSGSENSGSEDLFNNCGGGNSDSNGSCTENCNPVETPDGGVPEEVPEEVPEVVVPEVGVPEIVVEVGVPEVVVPEVVVPEVAVPEVVVTVTAPAPGATGNAGLAQSTGTSSIATLLLSAFAVVVVAGGRVASRMR